MPTLEHDLGYLEAGVKELEEYLLSNTVYWSLGASSPWREPEYPKLTLGGMLLAQARLKARRADAAQQARLAAATAGMEKSRSHWRVAWEKKAAREFHARLTLWRDFLEDVRTKPEEHSDRYPYEISRRVMLDLLRPQAAGIPQAEVDLLNALDGLLKNIFRSGPFIWDAELQSSFQEPHHWYLYGRLKGSGH